MVSSFKISPRGFFRHIDFVYFILQDHLQIRKPKNLYQKLIKRKGGKKKKLFFLLYFSIHLYIEIYFSYSQRQELESEKLKKEKEEKRENKKACLTNSNTGLSIHPSIPPRLIESKLKKLWVYCSSATTSPVPVSINPQTIWQDTCPSILPNNLSIDSF